MSKAGFWAIAGVAVLTLLYLVYLAATFDPPQGTSTVVLEPPALQPVTPTPAPTAPALPETRITPPSQPAPPAASDPVVQAPAVEVEPEAPVPQTPDDAVVQLPTLNASDAFVIDNLRALQNGATLVRMLASEQLVRKFVVFVHNVSQGELPQTDLPYQRITEEMPVTEIDEDLYVMDASAYRRFDQFVDAFVALDADQSMALYRTLSPLFQQAYAEIGFRSVEFDSTLRRAINAVLDSQQPEGPFQLVKPSVMYLYADSSIENLRAIDKQLIRLGPENAATLREKLAEFLERL